MQEVGVVVVPPPASRRTSERGLPAGGGGHSSFEKRAFRSLGALSRAGRISGFLLLGATALRLPVGRVHGALFIDFAAGGAISLTACACCETTSSSTATGGNA